MKKVLLSFQNGIGNFVMLSPTVVAIKELGYKVDFLLSGKDVRIKEIKNIISNWKEVGLYDEKKYDHYFYVWGENRQIPNLSWKMTASLFNQGQYSPALPWFLGHHEVVINFEIARYLGYKKEIPKLFIPTSGESISTEGCVDITLHIGSRPEEIWKKKRWPHWIKLITLLNNQYKCLFHLFDTKWEEKDRKNILSLLKKESILYKLHKCNITEAATVMNKSELVITTDSGPMHVAAATNTPVISLFGPTLTSKNGPWRSEGVVLQDSKCNSCLYTENFTKCTDNKCMKTITPEQVLDQAQYYIYKSTYKKNIVKDLFKKLHPTGLTKIHLIMPYYSTKPYGQESRLVAFLKSKEGQKLNLKYDISDLRLNPNKLDNFQNKYDATIVFKGEMLDYRHFKLMTGVKVLYFPDDIIVHKHYNEMVKKIGSYYDIVYTFDKKAISEFYALNCRDVRYWPSCTGSDLFYDQNLERDIDICFIGSMNKDRKKMLKKVEKTFPDKNLFFKEGIKGEEYAKHMNRSKIVLNLAQGISGVSQRVFEASACGAFVLTNNISEEEKLYIDTEIDYFNNIDDLISKLFIYLNHNETRIAYAKKAHEKTLKNHLINHRFIDMIKDIEKFRNENTVKI